MAMRLFLAYVLVELAVVIALTATIGFGWTVLVLVAAFALGLALAGSQLKKQVQRLRSGAAVTPQGAMTDSALVALGTVLVVIPGLASSVLGALLLLPPTRAVARPAAAALAARTFARRAPLITVVNTGGFGPARRGGYVDGEVIDVTDFSDDPAPGTPPRPLPRPLD
jgi:UPF0716 protein FxsA